MRVQVTRRGDDGAVALMIALLTVVLVGVLAFVVDFGLAHAHKRTLQNGADAAALAAAQALLESAPPTADCSTMQASASQADSKARTIFGENMPVTGAALVANSDGVKITCDHPGFEDYLVVEATGRYTSPSLFGGVLSGEGIALTATAKAVAGPVGEPVGLRPFAVCKTQAGDLLSAPGSIKTFTFGNIDTGCGTGSGAFGLLDLNGTVSDPSGGCNDLKEWAEFGYDASLPAYPLMLSEQGNCFGSLPLTEMMDKEIVIPVYKSMSEQTGKNLYEGVGFITIVPCGWGNDDAADIQGACYDQASWTTAAAAGGLNGQGSDPYALQAKYIRHMPPGDISLSCVLGAECDFGARVVKLAD